MKILVINAGSSSLKYQVIDMATETTLGKGIVERIGATDSNLVQSVEGRADVKISEALGNHTEALKLVLATITDKTNGFLSDMKEIASIGHRVLHSAEDFSTSVVFNEEVMRICEKNAVLGPLHQPANLACVRSCQEVLPGVPNVAVFDTVFHATMPDYAYMYAIKYEDYQAYKARKYGFHGTSHKFVTGEAIRYLNQPNSKIITCHLGNGSSIAAVVDGKCIDTSMGLTPLEGLVMGTRSGDVDAALVGYLAEQKGLSVQDVITYLNKESGFKGIAGGTGDFRDLCTAALENGDDRARLAIDMFAYRIKKYIGSYFAAMGGLDCVVFTGGIGENAGYAREKVMQGLAALGIDFDFAKNATAKKSDCVDGRLELHKAGSKVKVVMIPTNEELVIARETKALTSK